MKNIFLCRIISISIKRPLPTKTTSFEGLSRSPTTMGPKQPQQTKHTATGYDTSATHNDGQNTGDDRTKEQLVMWSEDGWPIEYYLTLPTANHAL